MNMQAEYWNNHGINLDVVSNILALCPSCHKQIHLGSRNARLKIISEVYVRNEARIKKVDKDINICKLVSYYNIALEEEEAKYWLEKARIKIEKNLREQQFLQVNV